MFSTLVRKLFYNTLQLSKLMEKVDAFSRASQETKKVSNNSMNQSGSIFTHYYISKDDQARAIP